MYNNTQVGKVKYTEMRSYMFEVNEKVVYGVVGVCEIEHHDKRHPESAD